MHFSHLALYCLSQEQGICVFCLAFHLPNTHLSAHSHLCSPQTSGDGEVPLKRSDRSDQKCLKEPEISMEWQIATGQTSRACRKLRPTFSPLKGEKQRDGQVRRWKAKQPWCIGSPQEKRGSLLCCFLPGTYPLLPSFLPDSESLHHCTSCPHFVLNQPSPNAA